MSLLAAKVGTGLGLLTGTAVGSYFLWDHLTPKNIEDLLVRRGYVIAESDSSFKAIYLGNKDNLKEIDVSSTYSDIKTGASRIRDWCQRNLRKMWNEETENIFHKAVNFCTINFSTARLFLLGQGYDSIIDDFTEENGKISLALFRGEKDFDLTIKNYSLNTGFAFRNWCNQQLDKKLMDLEVGVDILFRYCSPVDYEKLKEKRREKIFELVGWNDMFSENERDSKVFRIVRNSIRSIGWRPDVMMYEINTFMKKEFMMENILSPFLFVLNGR